LAVSTGLAVSEIFLKNKKIKKFLKIKNKIVLFIYGFKRKVISLQYDYKVHSIARLK
tara:strand:+ start:777 stop:947 length:171 start_codon:yes stop_codon:yes gene_type:complete